MLAKSEQAKDATNDYESRIEDKRVLSSKSIRWYAGRNGSDPAPDDHEGVTEGNL